MSRKFCVYIALPVLVDLPFIYYLNQHLKQTTHFLQRQITLINQIKLSSTQ